MEKTRTQPTSIVTKPAGMNGPTPAEPPAPLRVLVAVRNAAVAERLMSGLADGGMTCVAAPTAPRAAAQLGGSPGFDAALIDSDLGEVPGLGLFSLVRESGVALVVVSGEAGGADAHEAVAAMRAGAADLLEAGICRAELVQRVNAAGERSRSERRGRDRLCRLERLCRQLNESRSLVAREVEGLCDDLLTAYQEMSRHMNQVTVATEFKGLIKHELDIESLLRTTLEFTLARSGPTNAAVFLPTTSGDFSLGAYVNYDCPKETCDILLDHMANVIAPRFEHVAGMVHMTTARHLEEHLGDEAQWLGESHVIAFACRHGGECLAIFMLFRDPSTPFGPPLVDQMRTIGELFAAQLARVIHIHHRHLPKEKWGMIGDGEDEAHGDDYGLAA